MAPKLWQKIIIISIGVFFTPLATYPQTYWGAPPQYQEPYYPQYPSGYYPQHPESPQYHPKRRAKQKRGTARRKDSGSKKVEKRNVEKDLPAISGPPSARRITFVWGNSDSLEKVARACNTTPAEVLKENHLRRSELREGQVLQLPEPPENRRLPAFSEEQQFAREVWRGIRGGRRVALTFDAGGEPDGAPELLNALRDAGVSATFFVTGKFVSQHPDLVRQMAEQAHAIHNHSWSHPEFTGLSEERMHEELQRTDWAVRDVTGAPTTPFWRPPFGDRDSRVLRTAAQAGYQSIYWTIDSLDSVGEKKNPEFILNRLLDPPKSGSDPNYYLDGAILLMHVGEKGTARAVPDLIRLLRERGFELTTVTEILQPVRSVQEL